MTVIPIAQLGRRLPQAGRIRLGEQRRSSDGKMRPAALHHFRFTAKTRDPLVTLADLYGGAVEEWKEPKSDDRFQVTVDVAEIPVLLPPNCLDVNYELWGGGYVKRRCDGVTCALQIPTDEGSTVEEKDCLCAARGKLECQLKLRLVVILPEIKFLGLWRLDSSSTYAARELPGMVEGIQMMDAGRGIVRGLLRIEQRQDVVMTEKGPKKKKYIVPCLGVDATPAEIYAGQAGMAGAPALGAEPVERPALPAPADDEVIDAEVVERFEGPFRDEVSAWVETLTPRDQNTALRLARELAQAIGEPIPTTFDAVTRKTLEAIYDHVQRS